MQIFNQKSGTLTRDELAVLAQLLFKAGYAVRLIRIKKGKSGYIYGIQALGEQAPGLAEPREVQG